MQLLTCSKQSLIRNVEVSDARSKHQLEVKGFLCFKMRTRGGGGFWGLSPVHRKSEVSGKKKQFGKKQTGTKLLVRNVPFQASVRELRELFW